MLRAFERAQRIQQAMIARGFDGELRSLRKLSRTSRDTAFVLGWGSFFVLAASSGEVRVGDLPVTATTRARLQRTVGFVFQDADDPLFMPTVEEDIAFGPLNMGLAEDEVRRRVHEALATVGAEHLARRAPYRLSGGEKRAVAMAGVLAMSPAILVLDEPSSGLDPAARRRLITLLRSFDHTRIIATHDLDLVLDMCTRVLVLHEGRIAADGEPRRIFAAADLLARCHLEPPLAFGQPSRARLLEGDGH